MGLLYYKTCKFVILGENIWQKRTKNDRFVKHIKVSAGKQVTVNF